MEIESLEDEECSGKLSEVDNAQLRDIVEADPLTTTWEVAEELKVGDSIIIQHFKQTEKMKKLDKWCLMSWLEKKSRPFEVSSFLILHNNKPVLDQIVMWDKKWFLYNWWWSTQSLDQEDAPKHFWKPNLHQKKVSGSLLGGLLQSDPL